MPCHDAGAFIVEAIGSVLAQDYRPLELIVVDDGSTDGSGDLARSFGAPVVVLAQGNQGVAAARNVAIRHAAGEYVAFCDADDVWAPGGLRARIEALEEPPACDYTYGMVQNFLSPEVDEQRARQLDFPREPRSGRIAGSLVVRRAALDRVGEFCTAEVVGEFVDWIGRAADAGLTARAVDRVVLRRRVHGANSTLRSPDAPLRYLRVLKATLDRRRAGSR